MVSFSHTDDGTSEAAWAEGGVGELPELRLPVWDAQTLLLVAVAHPDDETLAAYEKALEGRRDDARL